MLKISYIFVFFLSLLPTTLSQDYPPSILHIIQAAKADGINLLALPFAAAAFASIEAIQKPVAANASKTLNGTRIDTHVHVVPDWYRAIVPTTGGNPTPEWDLESHLSFMATYGIKHDIISISSPGSGVYLGNETASVGLARLLNEWVAALVRTYPNTFSFYAVIPLPYVAAAIKEANYALTHLGALGVVLLSNHEGKYLGNPILTPFFSYLQSRNSSHEVVFIHPNSPVLNLNGSFISADPTVYPPGIVEFYFETARTIMDLTISQTINNFTKLHYVIPHVGGSFPSIEDRFIKSYPALESPAKQIFNSRFWWDSAGPVYYDQVKGLLGYGVPTSQLVFGTDYPYVPPFTYTGSIAAIEDATFLTAEEKQTIFVRNLEAVFA
ncbi:hypothetical protein MMC12_001526 [Toensbergia leucococca]|nr:hypothetical protein [Toensbergia leucococca]